MKKKKKLNNRLHKTNKQKCISSEKINLSKTKPDKTSKKRNDTITATIIWYLKGAVCKNLDKKTFKNELKSLTECEVNSFDLNAFIHCVAEKLVC